MTGSSTPVVVMEFFAAGGRLGGDRSRQEVAARTPEAGEVTCGAGRRSLREEGRALLEALLEDLAELPGVAPVAVVDRRSADALRPGARTGVTLVPAEGDAEETALRAAGARAGGFLWPVAPETRGRLARICRAAEDAGVRLVGPPSRGVRRVARRRRLLRRLERAGVATPPTAEARTPGTARHQASELGWPVVIKPGRGAGGAGTTRVDAAGGVEAAWARAAGVEPGFPPMVQPFVDGVPASVVMLCGEGGDVRSLALSRQRIRFLPAVRYEGGETPLRHPFARRALGAAADAVRAAGRLRGLVGVDLILTAEGPVVMEINPRLTTSYLGLRRHVGVAAAAAALRSSGHRSTRPGPGKASLPLGLGGAEPEAVSFGAGAEA